MKWLKRTGIVLGVIILILAVIPFFITLNDYIHGSRKRHRPG